MQNGVMNADSKVDSPFDGQPIHTERHLNIICIGAGASGLCFAYKVKRSFKNIALTILEKNSDLGGTWHENSYPGCACDIPSYIYTFSFEPKTDWKSLYSSAPEIKKYFQDFADKHRLRGLIKFDHIVESAKWDGETAQWNLLVCTNGAETSMSCDILILGTGYLNHISWPDIPGLKQFQGPMLHTAQWDHSVNLDGKVVGVLGNGSSAIQLIPSVLGQVAKVVNFIRSPTYVWDQANEDFTQEAIEMRKNDAEAYLALRRKYERMHNSLFAAHLKASPLQPALTKRYQALMQQKLIDPELQAGLIPKWGIGCRRLTPGRGYLDALTSDKTEVVLSAVSEFTARGCRTIDGRSFNLDIAVCATGFNTSFRPRFPLVGTEGIELGEQWKDAPKSYFGLAAPHFPNMMMFTGPQSPLAGFCILPVIEHQADYMLQMIDRFQTENIRSFSPKSQAVKDFIAHTNDFIRHTVWDEECSSWFKDRSMPGGISKLWPGSPLHYFEAIRELRADDWDIQYRGNRYNWLGNGFSQAEYDPSADLAYYVSSIDRGSFVRRAERREKLTKSGTQPSRVLHTILQVD